MMNISEIREHYFFQLAQKQGIHSAIQLPTTLVIMFIGILVVYANYLKYPFGLMEIMFSLSTISVIVGCVFLVKVLTFYKYNEIARIEDYLKYRSQLELYFQKNPNTEGNVEEDFAKEMAFKYAEAIDKNAEMNTHRFSDIYWANRFLIIAGILLALTLFPYLREKKYEPKQCDKIISKVIQRSESDE